MNFSRGDVITGGMVNQSGSHAPVGHGVRLMSLKFRKKLEK
jgi:hypothetical protein